MVHITPETVEKFRRMFKKEYGVNYTDKEAWEATHNLLGAFEWLLEQDKKQHPENYKKEELSYNMNMKGLKNTSGKFRQKRGDTLVGNLEKDYGVDFGVRSDMKLENYLEKEGLPSLSKAIKKLKK